MNKIITCEECGIDYYSETIVPRESFRHVFPDIVKLEAELADKDRQLAEITRQRNAYKKALEMAEDELMTVRAEIESLKLSAGELNGAFNARPKCENCKDKDKLVEQMREALKALRKYPNTYIATGQGGGIAENDLAMCDTALAAERGE